MTDALRPARSVRAVMHFHRQHHPYNCFYCGVSMISEPGHPHQITIDHVVPLSKGGVDALVNMVSACRECNRNKGSKSIDEFMVWMGRRLWAEAMHKQFLTRNRLKPVNRTGREWSKRNRA